MRVRDGGSGDSSEMGSVTEEGTKTDDPCRFQPHPRHQG